MRLGQSTDRWCPVPGLCLKTRQVMGGRNVSFQLHGLPSLAGDLVVAIERRPFWHSPGRWHWLCPSCGRLVHLLAEVSPKVPGGRGRPSQRQPDPTALALGWGCVACAGLQPSRSWSLSPARRLDLALERAADDRRHVGEKAKAWRRRRERAARTIARAQATDVNALERLAGLLEDPAG